jgi:hypothetical protein
MYFAFDLPSTKLPQQIANELHALRVACIGSSVNVFVLIDGAFDEGIFSKCLKGLPRISLYAGTDLEHLGEAAPFLVLVPEMKWEQASWLEELISVIGNRPMWSVIASSMDINMLAEHFGRYLVCKTEDSLEWPVRWGDIRVLPELLRSLDSKLIGELMRPIYRWLAASRTGELLIWSDEEIFDRENLQFEKIPLSDTVFKQLVDASEADAILCAVSDTQPELLKCYLPSECYRRVSRQLKIADKFNVEQPRIRQHFATLGLMLHEHLLDAPLIQEILESTSRGFDYITQIEALPDRFWRDLYTNVR